jgi:methylthioribose-1-phosphate isomerase
MSDADKESFDVLQKEVLRLQNEDIDERLSVHGLGVISYFSKIIQDKQVLTIWNSEKLGTTSVRLGTLLCLGVLASMSAVAALHAFQDRAGDLKYGVDALKLLSAVFGGYQCDCDIEKRVG